MSVDSDKKLTRYTSAVTVVTADLMNSLYGGEHGSRLDLDEYDPLVSGHVHDGEHADGHASKVLLDGGAHVRGHLAHANLGGTGGTAPAVQAVNIQCYSENIYGSHGGGNAIPAYTEDPYTGDRCYYLDLSMAAGGNDTEIQFNQNGGFGGKNTFTFDYNQSRVALGVPGPPEAKLTIGSSDNTKTQILRESDESIYGPDLYFDKSRLNDKPQDQDYLGSIAFRGWDGDNYQVAGVIQCRVDGAPADGDMPSEIRLITRPSGALLDLASQTRIIAKSDGKVGIGLEAPTCELDVSGSGAFSGDLTVAGKLTVAGLIDPTGLILTQENPDNVPTEAGEGAIFVSDGTGGTDDKGYNLEQNKLYYKDASGNIADMRGVRRLSELTDVNAGVEAPSPGHVLKYDGQSNTWKSMQDEAGTPADPDGSVQYNSAGVFTGESTIRINNSSLGVGVGEQDGPARRLHIKDEENPPVRINSLTRGEGHSVVWDENSGDLFYKAQDTMVPRIVSWPDSGDIVLAAEDRYSFIIVYGDWNGSGRVVVPSVPQDAPWEHSDYFWIKNMTTYSSGYTGATMATHTTGYMTGSGASDAGTNDVSVGTSDTSNDTASNDTTGHSTSTQPVMAAGYSATLVTTDDLQGSTGEFSLTDSQGSGSQNTQTNTQTNRSYIAIQVIGDSPYDTLDLEPFNVAYLLPPKNAIQLCCVKDESTDSGETRVNSGGGAVNHWFLVSHYHELSYNSDAPPNAEIKVVATDVNNPDTSFDVLNHGTVTDAYTTLTISGLYSSDPDGDSITEYIWTVTVDSDTADDIPTNMGSFTLEPSKLAGKTVYLTLSVRANGSESAQTTFDFTVDRANTAPVAVITSNSTTLETGARIEVSGESSYDNEGDSLTYAWTLLSIPSSSGVYIDGQTTNETIEFYPDVEGEYRFQLIVNDGQKDSSPAVFPLNISQANTAPTITLVGESSLIINEGSSYVDDGATAFDAEQGNISDSIAVTGADAVDTSVPGTYQIKYNVSDEHGAPAPEVVRTVTVNAKPVITIVGETTVSIIQGSSYTDAGATANDAEDGSIDVSTTGLPEDTSTPGTYQVKYNATDSRGLSADQKIRTVIVTANQVPVITLVGESSITVNEGASYTDAGATANDAEDGPIEVNTTGLPINTSAPGTYQVKYNATDSFGNDATEVIRTVKVNAHPVINVSPSSVDISEGDTYGEVEIRSGVTASDAEDGILTGQVSYSSNVNTSVPGSYTVIYNVTDADGAAATPVIRTVNVIRRNEDPVADISGDTIGEVGTLVQLDGRGSSDPDGDPISYSWSLVSAPEGSSVTIDSSADTVSFNPDVPGDYQVKLIVSDDGSGSGEATVTIPVSVQNEAPLIGDFGLNPSGEILTDDYVEFSVGISDDTDNLYSYQWALLSAPEGSTAQVDNTFSFFGGNFTTRTVTGNITPDLPGVYKIKITVQDNYLLSSSKELTLNVGAKSTSNQAPITNMRIGQDRVSSAVDSSVLSSVGFKDYGSNSYIEINAEQSYTIFFDASLSSDSDGVIDAWNWIVDCPAESVYQPIKDKVNPPSTTDSPGKPPFLGYYPDESQRQLLYFQPDVAGTYVVSFYATDNSGDNSQVVTIKIVSG
mgnify:CR=1 FL=1